MLKLPSSHIQLIRLSLMIACCIVAKFYLYLINTVLEFMAAELRNALLPSASERTVMNITTYSADEVNQMLVINPRYSLFRRKERVKLHVQSTLAKVNSIDNLSESNSYYDSPLTTNSSRKSVSFSEPLATMVTLVP